MCVMANESSKQTVQKRAALSQNTGLFYDARMARHKHPWSPDYPENPQRMTEPYDRLVRYGLAQRCTAIEAVMADDDLIGVVHSSAYIEEVKQTATMTNAELQAFTSRQHCAYFNEHTLEAARLAAGSSVEMTRAVYTGELRNGMSIVRPPGHHAMDSESCGYCVFNNVAIAAKYALDHLGAQRILIVDWDVHHGQATQYMFYDDPRVLYFSIHRFEHQKFWPSLRESNYDFIGAGPGRGYNINVPLNKVGMTNSDYLAIFHNLLLPVAYEFNPDLVLVSAGYDCAMGCFEGMMEVHPACFAYLTHKLMSLALGKVVVLLEGGYCIESLAESVTYTVRALLGDAPPMLEPLSEPSDSLQEVLLACVSHLRTFWDSLDVQEVLEELPHPDISHLAKNSWSVVRSSGLTDLPPPPLPEEKRTRYYGKLDELREKTDIPSYPNRTCLVYDAIMEGHCNEITRDHVECPARIRCIYDRLVQYGLVQRCKQIPGRHATQMELSAVHTSPLIAKVSETSLEETPSEDRSKSLYINKHTYDCALWAAGSLLSVVDEVCSGQSMNGMAIIRPPGHHAEGNVCMGFCIFNNVAVAARYAQTKFGIARILIVDWDVHHGNGTQKMFENDPSVLYISLHRYNHGTFYPGNKETAAPTAAGVGPGVGFNVNIGWNYRTIGNAEYLAAFHHLILPVAHQFNPDLVIVSAGFDACVGDPLGSLSLYPECYGHLTQALTCLARGRIVLALEGGYNLDTMPEAAAHCVSSLLGDPCTDLGSCVVNHSGLESIRQTMEVHQTHWKVLRFYKPVRVYQTAVDTLTEQMNKLSCGPSPLPVSPVQTSDHLCPVSSHDQPQLTAGVAGTYGTNATAGEDRSAGESLSASTGPHLTAAEELARAEGGATGWAALNVSDDRVRAFLGWDGTTDFPDHAFAVEPKLSCEHLGSVTSCPPSIDITAPCRGCGYRRVENWVCLTCYEVYCGREETGHMLAHHDESGHPLVLSFADISAWCYPCDAYLHNQVLFDAKRMVHVAKFGMEPTPHR